MYAVGVTGVVEVRYQENEERWRAGLVGLRGLTGCSMLSRSPKHERKRSLICCHILVMCWSRVLVMKWKKIGEKGTRVLNYSVVVGRQTNLSDGRGEPVVRRSWYPPSTVNDYPTNREEAETKARSVSE